MTEEEIRRSFELVAKLEEKKQKDADRLKQMRSLEEPCRKAMDLCGRISGKYSAFIKGKMEDFSEGRIALTVNDFYQFWTDLFVGNDVIFFRCTSRIDPKLWIETPDMQLYERRQMENVAAYKDKTPKEKYISSINNMFKKMKHNGVNFERIFLIDDSQRSDKKTLTALVSTISRQIKSGITVRVICIRSDERPTFYRPQDFGIVLTENEDKLLMYLEVGEHGEQEGGRIIFDERDIDRFEDYYLKMERKSRRIDSDNPEKIAELIKQMHSFDISDKELYGNRCCQCLNDAESRVDDGSWRNERTPRKTWYEVVYNENERLREELIGKRPREILEIGCGPGRVINQILKVRSEIRQTVTVVGYEQNTEICDDARDRFAHLGQQVDIQHYFVGEDKEGNWTPIKKGHERRFNMVLALSNIVGWQKNEERWIKEVLRALDYGGTFFFTVYRKGYELERARMYKASGDILKLKNGKNGDIMLVVDAFQGEEHVTGSYDKNEIEEILTKVVSSGSEFQAEPIFEVGRYMWGCLISKSEK